jgi:hypothetical protein
MRQISRNDHLNAERLRKLWAKKKHGLDLTQQLAAKRLGWTQSVVSQYLNCHIALNTDAILAFADLLECEPYDIDPALKTHFSAPPKKLSTKRIPIMAELRSLRYQKQHAGHLEAAQTSPGQYAIRVQTPAYKPTIRPGHYLIVQPVTEPKDGDYLLVIRGNTADIRVFSDPNLLTHLANNDTIEVDPSQELLQIVAIYFNNPLDGSDSQS